MIRGGLRSLTVGLLLASAIAVGALAAEPAAETVQVDGDGLSGIWKIASPEWATISLLGKVQFGPMLDRFCRMERAAKGFGVHCIGWDFRNMHSEGSLKGNKVYLSGGLMVLRFLFEGELTSPTDFVGTFGARVMGVRVDDPEKVYAKKLALTPQAADAAGHGETLRQTFADIANAAPGASLIPAAGKRGHFNRESLTPELLQRLGNVEAVIYLGEATRPHDPKAAGQDVSIYDVEFAHGERLCAVDKDHGVSSGIVCA